MSDLLSFIISNAVKHEFSSIWNWISCCNDVMNQVDCVIKRDAYPQKMYLCCKNIRDISKIYIYNFFNNQRVTKTRDCLEMV